MTSHTVSATTLPQNCNQNNLSAQIACLNRAAKIMASNTTADPIPTTTVTVPRPTVTITKQVGSVVAFGDGPGAAKPSTTPLQEPKPTPISKPMMERDVTTLSKQVGKASAYPDGRGEQYDAWVQSITPATVVPLPASVTVHQDRDYSIQTMSVHPASQPPVLQNRDYTAGIKPTDPASLAAADSSYSSFTQTIANTVSGKTLIPDNPEFTTTDTQITPAEATVTISPVHRHNHTTGLNGTGHKTHHHHNQTKTITDEVTKTLLIEKITKTKLVTKSSNSFPQLSTQNSSANNILYSATPTLDAQYSRLTYHNDEAAQPGQTASFGTFQPAIPEITHRPISSGAANIHSSATLFYGIVAIIVLFVALVPLVHYALTDGPEEELIEVEVHTDPETLAKLQAWEEKENHCVKKRQAMWNRAKEESQKQENAEEEGSKAVAVFEVEEISTDEEAVDETLQRRRASNAPEEKAKSGYYVLRDEVES